MPRLIATDLDGTFLSPDGSVSEQNAAAVAAAQAAGIPVLFATGRPVRWLDVIRDLPGAHPTVIASNGAALYDLGAGELLDRICIDPETALAAVRRIREVVPDASFAFESGTRFGYEPAYRTWPADDGTNPALYRGPAEEVAVAEEFVKMLVQSQSVAAGRPAGHRADRGGRHADGHALPDPGLRAGRDQRRRGDQGEHAAALLRPAGHRRAPGCRLRGHAE